nr:hypothetical protein [Tanacetum cinerariifolium]
MSWPSTKEILTLEFLAFSPVHWDFLGFPRVGFRVLVGRVEKIYSDSRFDSQKNHSGIDVLQHVTHVECSVAKVNDHPIVDISVKAIHVDEFAGDFIDVLNDEQSIPKYSLDDMKLQDEEEKFISTPVHVNHQQIFEYEDQSKKSQYVNVVTDDYKPFLGMVFDNVKAKRKKCSIEKLYVLRPVKERKKRLAMALNSSFGQQATTTPAPPKTISRSVNRDFITPLEFLEIFLLKDMDQASAHMVAASKVPMLKPDEFEIWRIRIKQYIQMIDYVLWEVIENGATLPKTQVVECVTKEVPITTVEEKAQRRLEVKARSTLMMGISNKHKLKFNFIKDAKQLLKAIERRFGGNAATKKNKRNLLKQQYKNFIASSLEMLNQTFDRLQKLNMAFVSSSNNNTSSTNGAVNTAQAVNTANGVSTASTQVNDVYSTNIDNLSDVVMCSFFASQLNRRKITVNGNETIGFDKSKVECYNCHKNRQFARECRALRNQDNKHKESSRMSVSVETSASTALVSCDGIGGYEWSDQAEEGPNYALMVFSSSNSDSKVSNDSTCSKSCLEIVKLLKSQNEKLLKDLKKSELMVLVQPPYTRNFMPLTPDLSFTGLDEFVNKPIVENCKAKSSEKKTKVVKKNDDAPIIEEWVSDNEEEDGNPQMDLHDQGVINSGCSRHITRNMSYLIDYKEIDKGYVAFGGNPKGEKITKKENSISLPLHLLHMDLFGPTFVKSLVKKMYCLVVIEDYNRFTWVFFLATMDETSGILKSFITRIENLVDHKVKVIRCDNRTEFKNREMNQFYEMKGVLRQFSVARTPQQNRVAERRTRTLIVAARTMLADSKTPTLVFMRPFMCPVTILNTIDHLGKFDGKADEGFFVGYFLNSKAFKLFNNRTMILEENLHIRFSESTPNVVSSGPDWIFDIDALTRTMNYELNFAGTQSNSFAGTKASDNAGQARKETEHVKDYISLPLWTFDPPFSQDPKSSHDDGSKPSSDNGKKVDEDSRNKCECNDQEKEDNVNITNNVNTASSTVNAAGTNEDNELPFNLNMPTLEDVSIFNFLSDDEDDGAMPDMNNLDTTIQVSPISTIRIHKDYPLDQVIGDLQTSIQTRKMSKNLEEHGFMSSMGELTFFLGLQVNQKKDGIFISQDKYVAKILKKFKFTEVKTASTPMETQKPLLKDEGCKEVDVHMYRSMIGSLMYLTSSRPDIMFAVCACARYQVNPKVSHLHVVKRIFRLLWLVFSWFLDYHFAGKAKKSCWSTAMAKTINGEAQLHARVDGKKIIITEASIRRDLQLTDKEGVDCLPNSTIFEQLTLIGTVASAIICLATSQKFIFSKWIFDCVIRNLDNVYGKILIYLRKPIRKLTQVLQPSDPMEQVADEVVHKELGDSLVRAATTASSLGAEQDNNEESLGEDASKQGRIEAIDADEDINLVNDQDDADKNIFDVNILGGEEVFAAAGQKENIVNITIEEITLAQALKTLKTSKPKSQDKGKRIMIEEPIKPKKKDQTRLDEEATKMLQAEFDEEERLAREKAKKNKKTELVKEKEKRVGEELIQKSTKKQKVEDDKEKEELKQLMETILDEEEVAIVAIPLAIKSPRIVDWKIHKEGKKSYYQIIRADGKSQMYIFFSQMLKSFNKEDLKDLYKLDPHAHTFLKHNSMHQSYGSCVVGLSAVIMSLIMSLKCEHEVVNLTSLLPATATVRIPASIPVLAVLNPERLKVDKAQNE